MKQRTASRLAWTTGLVSIALIVAQLVLMFVDRHVPPPPNYSSGRSFANVLSNATNIPGQAIGIVMSLPMGIGRRIAMDA